MSDEGYYKFWLNVKNELQDAIIKDEKLQSIAVNKIGIAPQGYAVEEVSRVYASYCHVFNKICECYDQMTQIQRRPYIRDLIDSVTCRILELKETLQEVEVFEYTYAHNALQQMIITPYDIEILCPFFYSLEMREEEMQFIIDEIMAGNRIGDITPSPSELDRREEAKLEEEKRIQEEKFAEIKRKQAIGEDIIEEEEEIPLSPEELETRKLKEEFDRNVSIIQMMERCRVVTRQNIHKVNQNKMTYMELAGIKKPPASLELREKAAALIQMVGKRFMKLKRDHLREQKVKELIGMACPSYSPPSLKIKWEKVMNDRRKFRTDYFKKWLQVNITENSRIMRLRRDDIMVDISQEVRAWMQAWHRELGLFDEYPWPEEGGSILVVRGETFTFDEYREWRKEEDKKAQEEPKSKEQIKAEKKAAKEEKKKAELDRKVREKKELDNYKKSRLNPEKDPGIYVQVAKRLEGVQRAYRDYKSQWKYFDVWNAPLDVVRGYIFDLITENQAQEVHLELRPIVDELMRLELIQLKLALKADWQMQEQTGAVPMSKKRKKPKMKKKPKDKNKRSPANMFQELVDEGIVVRYSKITLNEFWGERNYASADLRAIPWLPVFTPPGIGDVRDQFRIQCTLALGSDCTGIQRAILLAGPRYCGKRTLIHAIATETNAVLMDLSPGNIYNKYPGPQKFKELLKLVNKMSRLLQPTIIMVDNAEKVFYKKVPKEEKEFDPTRLKGNLFKDIIKPLKSDDKVLVLGTTSEPWVAAVAQLKKAFTSVILFPKTDYATISAVLYKLLMKYHGVNREFNVHSVAQVIRGYDIGSIRKAVEKLMEAKRVSQLTHEPLEPMELLSFVLEHGEPPLSDEDYQMFLDWYSKFSPWGLKYDEYRFMLDTQYELKLKNDKKKKGGV